MSTAVTTHATELQNCIGGSWRRSAAAEYVDVTNPATGELLARTPLSTAAEVDAAVQAAAEAFPAWRRTPPGERVQYLFKLKNLLEEHLDELSRLITTENGKTFAEAKAELRRAIENVEVACGTPILMQGYNLEDVTPGVDEALIRQPLGVVAAIMPFNFPAMIAYWFLPYAIACGNTFVMKPSERVPLSRRRGGKMLGGFRSGYSGRGAEDFPGFDCPRSISDQRGQWIGCGSADGAGYYAGEQAAGRIADRSGRGRRGQAAARRAQRENCRLRARKFCQADDSGRTAGLEQPRTHGDFRTGS